MWRVGIAGGFSDLFLEVAREQLRESNVLLECVNLKSSGTEYDALLVSQGADISAYKISNHILIVPDDVTIRDSSAQCVITYGLSPKNSVTLSSTDNNKYTLAIQRDIISLGGSIVLRQEFSLDSILSQYETMALASLLAISDLLEQ